LLGFHTKKPNFTTYMNRTALYFHRLSVVSPTALNGWPLLW